MTHTATLYIADKVKNEFMRLFDMRPDYKWYIDRREASFETASLKIHLSPSDYFHNIISKSKENLTVRKFFLYRSCYEGEISFTN